MIETTEAQILGFLTIIAIIVGPVLAVLVTRLSDDRRLKRQRRMAVFRDLMRTRRMRLTPDHVGALNLVEIEFDGEIHVIEAWRNYMAHLSKRIEPTWTQEQTDQFLGEQEKLLARLLHAIAKSLKFQIDQLDIFQGGYLPEGWADEDRQQRALRLLLIELLRGNRGLPITPVINPTPQMPFPPPPKIDQPTQANTQPSMDQKRN